MSILPSAHSHSLLERGLASLHCLKEEFPPVWYPKMQMRTRIQGYLALPEAVLWYARVNAHLRATGNKVIMFGT